MLNGNSSFKEESGVTDWPTLSTSLYAVRSPDWKCSVHHLEKQTNKTLYFLQLVFISFLIDQGCLQMVASVLSTFKILCIMITRKRKHTITLPKPVHQPTVPHSPTQHLDFTFPDENSVRAAYSTMSYFFFFFPVGELSIN